MKTIALIAQKGGVGKTTLAINLAVACGVRAAIFDMDQQESAAIWADRRKSDLPHVEFLTERRLSEGLKAAARGKFALSIIDTPPAAGPQALTAAQASDLILIPCRPSLVDLDAIRRTAQLVKSVAVPAFVVFNAAPHSATTLLEDARAIAEETGLKIAPTVLASAARTVLPGPLGKRWSKQNPTARQPKKSGTSRSGFLHSCNCAHLQKNQT